MQNTNKIKDELQNDALEKFKEHYYKNKETRGILCACCGYGKSYLMYKLIKECINRGENLFIIATSRIKLLEQLGPDFYQWNTNDKNKWNLQISVFCSENITCQGETKYDKIKFNIDSSELINKITEIKKNTINIILTTYNSANKIVEKIGEYNKKIEKESDSNLEMIEPDLIILDEAHNTVGSGSKKGEKFHHDLFKTNEHFESSKYLFMTATPLKMVHKNPNSKINTDETIYSMDNTKTYGKIFYYYTFSEAIKDGIITDFQTIKLEQSKEFLIPQDIKNKITSLSKSEREKKYFNEISSLLIQSSIRYNFKKTIVYISNKTKAELLRNILEQMQKGFKNMSHRKFSLDIYKIVDDMTNTEKKKEQEKFIRSERSVLISVNIFNEGVDIPCVDSVMFAEERYSQTTIVQNIGRCLRLDSNNKNKLGYVIIPNILYEIAEDENNQFYSSKFKVIRNCINIIKNNKSKNFLFKKFTNNKNNLENIDSDIDSGDDNDIENELDDEINNVNNENKINLDIDGFMNSNIELLKYFKITGTFDGYISNTTLDEIREKYVIKEKINNIKDYAYKIKKDKNDQWLRLDIDYKNEWISWNNFLTNIESPKYEDAKKIIENLCNDHKLDIKKWSNFKDIYDYLLSNEQEEEYDYEQSPFGNNNFKLIDNIKRRDKKQYNKIVDLVFKIPNQPEKFYKSSGSWISMEDFLGYDKDGNQINNKVKPNNQNNQTIDLDKNLKNLLNNDNTKVKKGKWNNIKIEIPKQLINQLVNDKVYDENKLNLVVQYRLNKNYIYDTSIIILEDKNNKNILGKISLEDNKVEYIKNILNKTNQKLDEIKYDVSLYFDKDIEKIINNLITEIKNKVNKNQLNDEIEIPNILLSTKNNNSKNIIIVDENNKIESNNLSQNLNNTKNEYDKLIKKYSESSDKYERTELLFKIRKYYPNFRAPWSDDDKNKLINHIKNDNNITLDSLMKITGRNDGGIVIQLKKLLEENKIKINDLSKNIKNELLDKDKNENKNNSLDNQSSKIINHINDDYDENRFEKYAF
jgi:superfamily II DNA or RNA helicase